MIVLSLATRISLTTQSIRSLFLTLWRRNPMLADTKRGGIGPGQATSGVAGTSGSGGQQDDDTEDGVEYYRLRSFSITANGVFNLGDSLKSRRSRSINSVTSSGGTSCSSTTRDARLLSSTSQLSGIEAGRRDSNGEVASSSPPQQQHQQQQQQQAVASYKVGMLGASGVGKTALTAQFTTSEYICAYDASLGRRRVRPEERVGDDRRPRDRIGNHRSSSHGDVGRGLLLHLQSGRLRGGVLGGGPGESQVRRGRPHVSLEERLHGRPRGHTRRQQGRPRAQTRGSRYNGSTRGQRLRLQVHRDVLGPGASRRRAARGRAGPDQAESAARPGPGVAPSSQQAARPTAQASARLQAKDQELRESVRSLRPLRNDDSRRLINSNQTSQEQFKRLKSMRENVNWDSEAERRELFDELRDLFNGWNERLPNLRDIFRREEMDWLLTEFVKTDDGKSPPHPILNFAIEARYRDEPELGADGKPSSVRRTTPLHHLFKFCTFPYWNGVARDLFRIYDRFDVNYTDERGRTHFHAACQYGCNQAVRQFLESGLDLKRLVQETDLTVIDPPLYLALNNQNKEVFTLLLKHGADPNFGH
ncbi:unnamed protein product [Trichogramma brassicae]|uniref:Uncharacterized protein n=1 Tax=Trichogramma brassicae TaxID=86971 RepID=A0A6H5J6P5_9HYME|nr:unnamed protein product [Trichogramma brassicae]